MPFFPVDTSQAGQDISGTITTGGTAQTLTSSVANGFRIHNPGTVSLWFSEGGTAAPGASGSEEIAARGSYETPSGYTPPGAVSIYGSVTGQPFTAKKW